MPLTVALAHRLNQKMAELRRSGECAWLRPDSKTQVTIEHELRDGEVIPLRVHTVVISVQHSECISLEDQREQLKSKVYINDG